MPVNLKVTIAGESRLLASLARLAPSQNPRPMRRALIKSALLVQKIATKEKIKRGGGKSKAKPEKDRLTSRTGTGRRSIRVNRGELPRAIEVGSALGYMALHEKGGTVNVPSYTRAASNRSRLSGNAKAVRVKGYTATFPARPYLKPALADAVKSFETIFLSELAIEANKA